MQDKELTIDQIMDVAKRNGNSPLEMPLQCGRKLSKATREQLQLEGADVRDAAYRWLSSDVARLRQQAAQDPLPISGLILMAASNMEDVMRRFPASNHLGNIIKQPSVAYMGKLRKWADIE